MSVLPVPASLPRRPFLRRLSVASVAALLAAGLALGGATAPAAAMDRGEATRAIIGITALGLLVHQLSQQSSKAESHRPTPPPAVRPRPGHTHPRPAQALPARCAFEIGARGRQQTVLDRPCIERQMRRAPQLPAACVVNTTPRERWSHQRADRRSTLYGLACLQRAGFTLDRRYR